MRKSANRPSASQRPSKTESVILWLVFTLFAANLLVFVRETAWVHPVGDVWRHLQDIVLPYFRGEAGLGIFWSNHHPFPSLHFIQILSLSDFGFQQDVDAYLGLAFQLTIAVIILIKIIRSTNAFSQGVVGQLGLISITILFLGLNSLQQYTWPLVAHLQHVHFVGLLFLLALDRCVVYPERKQNLLWITATTTLILLWHRDFAMIYLVSGLTLLALIALREKEVALVRPMLIIIALLGAFSIALSNLSTIDDTAHFSRQWPSSLAYYLTAPVELFTRFSLALLTGVLNVPQITLQQPELEPMLAYFGLLTGVLFVAAALAYFYLRLYRQSVLPLGLMAMVVMFGAATIFFRGHFGDYTPWSIARERYAPTFNLGVIGAFWALWLVHQAYAQGRKASRSASLMAALLLTAFSAVQCAQIYFAWDGLGQLRYRKSVDEISVFLAGQSENTVTMPASVLFQRRSHRSFDDAMAHLTTNRLSVFSDDYRAGQDLRNLKEAHRGFHSAPAVNQRDLEVTERCNVPWQADNRALKARACGKQAKFRNDSSRSAWVRLTVVSTRIGGRGLHFDEAGKHRTQRLLPGRQVWYIKLAPGADSALKVQPPARITAVQVRPSAAP